MLRFRLSVGSDGDRMWVRDMVAGSPAVLLSTMRQQHVQRRIFLAVPPCSAEVSLDCAIYVMPTGGFFVRFSLLRLLYALSLCGYDKNAGRWVRSMADSLARRADRADLPSSLQLPRQYANDVEKNGQDPGRHLGWPSCHTGALVLWLFVWAFAKPHEGGFRDLGDRQAAACFLRGLIGAAFGAQWHMVVFLVADAHRTPPMPPTGGLPRRIVVTADGMLDIGAWRRHCLAESGTLVVADVLRLPIMSSRETSAPLYDVIAEIASHMASSRPLQNIFSQLVWGLSERLDRNIESIFRGGGALAGLRVDSCGADAGRQRAELLQGHLASQRLAGEHPDAWLHNSCCLDKSRVSGLGKQNAAFAVPENTVWWAPPQACLVYAS